jgi:hypothetical protein
MSRTLIRLSVLTGLLGLGLWAEPPLNAQVTPHVERAVDESGPAISCEVFCSETKLRTANARIRWSLSRSGGPEAESLASARHSLQTTVFHQGFEKRLYVTLPVGGTTPGRPVAATPQAEASRPLRAYEIVVVENEKARATEAGAPELGVVVENLEPGVNYCWRVVAEAGATQVVTPTVYCQAPVCPADMVGGKPMPPPRRRP